ncbi:unnamed protein product [Ectocarpus sp. CCAP 1310/34]|nr:unnamed protein product [Ectocarpus sp. CCAP 1310/34]
MRSWFKYVCRARVYFCTVLFKKDTGPAYGATKDGKVSDYSDY